MKQLSFRLLSHQQQSLLTSTPRLLTGSVLGFEYKTVVRRYRDPKLQEEQRAYAEQMKTLRKQH